MWHNHAEPIENVENTTLYDVIARTMNVTDLHLSVFMTLEVSVCVINCSGGVIENEIRLSDE